MPPCTTTYVDQRYILSELYKLNSSICILQRNVSTISSSTATAIARIKLQAVVDGDGDIIVTSGDDIITITDSKIIADSVDVFLGGSLLPKTTVDPEEMACVASPYTATDVTITFNQGLSHLNKVIITYLKYL